MASHPTLNSPVSSPLTEASLQMSFDRLMQHVDNPTDLQRKYQTASRVALTFSVLPVTFASRFGVVMHYWGNWTQLEPDREGYYDCLSRVDPVVLSYLTLFEVYYSISPLDSTWDLRVLAVRHNLLRLGYLLALVTVRCDPYHVHVVAQKVCRLLSEADSLVGIDGVL